MQWRIIYIKTAMRQKQIPSKGRILIKQTECKQSKYINKEILTRMTFAKLSSGSWTTIKNFDHTVEMKDKMELKVVASGTNFTFYLEGTQLGTATDSSFSSGTVGLRSINASSGRHPQAAYQKKRCVSLASLHPIWNFKNNIIFQSAFQHF
jgi:hypothetical protein